MRSPSHIRILKVLAILLTLAAGAGLTWTVHALVVCDHRAGHPLLVCRVRPGDRLALGFVHSVEHGPVRDWLVVDKDYGLTLVETEFASSRSGQPYAASADEIFSHEADHFRIRNMNRPVPEIYQWVQAAYDNRLVINAGTSIRLDALAGDTLLHIRIQSLSGLQWAWLKVESCRARWIARPARAGDDGRQTVLDRSDGFVHAAARSKGG